MKTSATYSVALAALVLAATASASPHRAISTVSRQVAGLRQQIAQHRSRTWHFQDLAGVAHTPTRYAERRSRSVPYLHWINHLWNHRQRVARHTALHPAIAHRDLWLCIHGTLNPYGHWEAHTWNNEDTGHNQHWGGLQMHWDWGWNPYTHSGYGLPGDAAHYSAYQQMAAAERGYKANGYSQAWLLQQWYHPECLKYA